MSRRALGIAAVVGAIGWAGLVVIGAAMLSTDPPSAGFDLALLLEGGERVRDGLSPYDPELLAGRAPRAEDLFYSYPPPVAQVAAVVAGVPLAAALAAWAAIAFTGLALITRWIARTADAAPLPAAVVTLAVAPFLFPYAIALLFGNLDAIYPLAYGAVLLAALPGASRPLAIGGGVALALVTIAKLHPGLLGAWLLARALTGPVVERTGAWVAVAAAAVTAAVVVAVSLAIGGVAPWLDYLAVIQAGVGADIVDARNIAPVSLLGQLGVADAGVLRAVQVVVAAVTLLVALAAAWRVREPIASFAVAASASLVALPVTWYHYPVALIPVGVALAVFRPGARSLVAVAAVLATLAIGWLPATWLAVAVLVVAAAGGGRVTVSPALAPRANGA